MTFRGGQQPQVVIRNEIRSNDESVNNPGTIYYTSILRNIEEITICRLLYLYLYESLLRAD